MSQYRIIPALAGKLSCSDFPGSPVNLQFEDGSTATFKRAFYTLQTQANQDYYVVYTEHCGYHVFSKLSLESISGQKIS